MADVNHVTVIGRLTRDAELKYTAGGQAVCKFAIASNYRKKDGDKWIEVANFFDVVLWGRPGEVINQFLTKGKQVAVEGELRQDRWEQDGQNRSKVGILASNVQLLGGTREEGQGSTQKPQDGETHQDKPNSAAPQQGASQEGDDNFTDDIPF